MTEIIRETVIEEVLTDSLPLADGSDTDTKPDVERETKPAPEWVEAPPRRREAPPVRIPRPDRKPGITPERTRRWGES